LIFFLSLFQVSGVNYAFKAQSAEGRLDWTDQI